VRGPGDIVGTSVEGLLAAAAARSKASDPGVEREDLAISHVDEQQQAAQQEERRGDGDQQDDELAAVSMNEALQ
jgi:hypothetical protein